MRLFVALELPARTRDNLARSSRQFEDFATSGNFVAPQNFHITLHFLGEVAESDVMYVQNAMDGVKDLVAPKLSVLQFTTLRGSDVVCAKLKNNKELTELHARLGQNLENNNFAVEHRAYRPHITISRKAKFTLPFTEVVKSVDVFNAPFCADRVVLYQSELAPQGPIYKSLYEVTLKQE